MYEKENYISLQSSQFVHQKLITNTDDMERVK